MKQNNFLFGSATFDSAVADVGRLLLRLSAGLALALAHGWRKLPPADGFVGRLGEMGFPMPELFGWLAALAEFGGGLLIAVGLLTRPAAFVVVIHFAIVIFIAHEGDPFGRRELPMLFGMIALFYTLAGAGRYSLDALIRSRLSGPRF